MTLNSALAQAGPAAVALSPGNNRTVLLLDLRRVEVTTQDARHGVQVCQPSEEPLERLDLLQR